MIRTLAALCLALPGLAVAQEGAPPPPDAGPGIRDPNEPPPELLTFEPDLAWFGEVPVGEHRRIVIRATPSAADIVIDHVEGLDEPPLEEGLAIDLGCPLGTPVPEAGCDITIDWTPPGPGRINRRVILRLDGGGLPGFAIWGRAFDPDAPDRGVPGGGPLDAGAGGTHDAGGDRSDGRPDGATDADGDVAIGRADGAVEEGGDAAASGDGGGSGERSLDSGGGGCALAARSPVAPWVLLLAALAFARGLVRRAREPMARDGSTRRAGG